MALPNSPFALRPGHLEPRAAIRMLSLQFGVEGTMAGSIQASSQWQTFFHNPTGSALGILSSISTLGLVAGNPIAPYVSDRLGRKGGLLVGATGTIIFVAIQASAQNLRMYLAGRFFLGMFLLICHNASPTFLSEFAPTKERSTILGLYIPMYLIGGIVISWTCYSTVNWASDWSWRAPSLVQLVPAVLQLAMLRFVPESPRWLALHGRHKEALAVLVKYHGGGHVTDEVQATYREIIENTNRQAEGGLDKGEWKDLFATKSMRVRSVLCLVVGVSSQFSGKNVISYYITLVLTSVGITDGKSQTLLNGMLNVWSLIVCVAVAFLSQRVGRRPIFIIGIAAMLLIWCTFTGLSGGYTTTGGSNAVMGAGVLAMIFLFNAAYGSVWSTMFMYPIEMWPSGIRAKAFAMQSTTDYVGLFINVYVNPIAMEAISWKWYILFCVLLAAQLLFAYFLFPETKGLSTEQICDYFDGQVGKVHWFAGPKSKELLLESRRISVARQLEMTHSAGIVDSEKMVDLDRKSVDVQETSV